VPAGTKDSKEVSTLKQSRDMVREEAEGSLKSLEPVILALGFM
jgi:hypothetical protein